MGFYTPRDESGPKGKDPAGERESADLEGSATRPRSSMQGPALAPKQRKAVKFEEDPERQDTVN